MACHGMPHAVGSGETITLRDTKGLRPGFWYLLHTCDIFGVVAITFGPQDLSGTLDQVGNMNSGPGNT